MMKAPSTFAYTLSAPMAANGHLQGSEGHSVEHFSTLLDLCRSTVAQLSAFLRFVQRKVELERDYGAGLIELSQAYSNSRDQILPPEVVQIRTQSESVGGLHYQIHASYSREVLNPLEELLQRSKDTVDQISKLYQDALEASEDLTRTYAAACLSFQDFEKERLASLKAIVLSMNDIEALTARSVMASVDDVRTLIDGIECKRKLDGFVEAEVIKFQASVGKRSSGRKEIHMVRRKRPKSVSFSEKPAAVIGHSATEPPENVMEVDDRTQETSPISNHLADPWSIREQMNDFRTRSPPPPPTETNVFIEGTLLPSVWSESTQSGYPILRTNPMDMNSSFAPQSPTKSEGLPFRATSSMSGVPGVLSFGKIRMPLAKTGPRRSRTTSYDDSTYSDIGRRPSDSIRPSSAPHVQVLGSQPWNFSSTTGSFPLYTVGSSSGSSSTDSTHPYEDVGAISPVDGTSNEHGDSGYAGLKTKFRNLRVEDNMM